MYPSDMNGSVKLQASSGQYVSLFFSKYKLSGFDIRNIVNINKVFKQNIM